MVKFHQKVIWYHDPWKLLDKFVVSQIYWNTMNYIDLFIDFKENMS